MLGFVVERIDGEVMPAVVKNDVRAVAFPEIATTLVSGGPTPSKVYSLEQFVREYWSVVPGAGRLIWNWHISVLCDELQTVAERVFVNEEKLYDLVINVPPGTSKSSLVSILYPVWVWTRMPTARFITASHTDSLVLDLAGKSRGVISSERYQSEFPNIQLKLDKGAIGDFANTLGGERKSCTVAGKSPTGRHAHFLVCDDLIDPKKSLSAAELKTAADFVTQVLPSRKVRTDKDIAVIILVMQRLHGEDPSAVMLDGAKKEGATPVKHYCLPAELLEDGTDSVFPEELKQRYINRLLDPVRLPKSVLRQEEMRNQYAYAGQYRQKPVPPGGQMFKEHYFNKRVKAAPFKAQRIRYWDRACLVAGTMVETARGPCPIELVGVDDLVLTRNGYRRVLWAGVTKKASQLASVSFANGASLVGTLDHPVWTANRYWVDLASLDVDDYITCLNDVTQTGSFGKWQWQEIQNWRSDSSTASGMLGSGTAGTLAPIRGTKSKKDTSLTRCIERFGVSTTVTSPTDIRYITLTETGTTTTSRTSNALHQKITISGMGSLRSGIRHRLISNTGKNSWWPLSGIAIPLFRNKEHVNNAVVGFLQSIRTQNGSGFAGRLAANALEAAGIRDVAVFAGLPFGDARKLVRINAIESVGSQSVRYAGSCSEKEVLGKSAVAANAPIRFAGLQGVPVYDLVVEEAHEFFANGILVHNSTENAGCRTAGVLIAKSEDGNYFVENVVCGQWEPDERNQQMLAAAYRDRERYGPSFAPVIWVEREGGSSGRDAWKSIAKILDGFPVREDMVTGNKAVRAEPWSSMAAAGNVYLIDDGTWDLNDYIKEHTLFPLGKLKDQVDASSGGYNLLSGAKKTPTIYVHRYHARDSKWAGPKIVVCARDQLEHLLVDERSILISVNDPHPLGTPEVPPSALNNLLDSVAVQFADMDPLDHQQSWGKPIEPYDKPVSELVMRPQDGKRIWSVLLRKRDPAATVYVIQDSGDDDRRALSLAYAVCDIIRIPRGATINRIGFSDDDAKRFDGDPPNRHVFEVLKASRGLVI